MTRYSVDDRKGWLGLLARSTPTRLAGLMPQPLPPHHDLRPPEIGTMMVQGRTGATGQAFNMGEMTVTRCALQLECGTVGHAMVQGRDRAHARRAALIDALMQTPRADELQRNLLTPLSDAEAQARAARNARAATTRVEFFTLVRGEDQ